MTANELLQELNQLLDALNYNKALKPEPLNFIDAFETSLQTLKEKVLLAQDNVFFKEFHKQLEELEKKHIQLCKYSDFFNREVKRIHRFEGETTEYDDWLYLTVYKKEVFEKIKNNLSELDLLEKKFNSMNHEFTNLANIEFQIIPDLDKNIYNINPKEEEKRKKPRIYNNFFAPPPEEKVSALESKDVNDPETTLKQSL